MFDYNFYYYFVDVLIACIFPNNYYILLNINISEIGAYIIFFLNYFYY